MGRSCTQSTNEKAAIFGASSVSAYDQGVIVLCQSFICQKDDILSRL